VATDPAPASGRRSFLRTSLAPMIVPGSVLGRNGAVPPSDRIAMGLIGAGSRGRLVLGYFLEQKDVRMVAVSDCFADRRLLAKQQIDAHYGNQDCTTHRLHERILERKDIDAVLVATGDRWHAVMSGLAARAGKDVYCEKPFCLTIAEGRALVTALQRHKTVWQCGTQRRSHPTWKFVAGVVHSGRIGKLKAITTSFGDGPWRRTGFPVAEPAPDPDVFDYDRWLGQAPAAAYAKVRVELWRLNWATSAGAIADMGAHYFEIAQWARRDPLAGPVEFDGHGVFRQDGGFNNIPYFYNVRARYADGTLLIMDPSTRGVRFDGEDGWIGLTDEGAVSASSQALLQGLPDLSAVPMPRGHWNILAPHIRDFLDAVRSRGETVSNPEIAHRAHTIIHCANIGLRLGRKVRWDAAAERFVGDTAADAMLARPMRAPWRIQTT
jgi:predicted dehydrogenase